MRICSWDVGIKNLAYCVINKEDDKFTIEHWEVINLTKTDEVETCTHDKCKKTATFRAQCSDDTLCNMHMKKKLKEAPSIDDIKDKFTKSKNKNTCCIEGCTSQTFQVMTDTNDHYCGTHKTKHINDTLKNFRYKQIKSQNANKLSPHELSKTLCLELDKREHLLDVDEVIIENQPRLMNPVMGRIASCLATYFVIRGCVDSDKNIQIRNISPSNKMKINNDKSVEIINKEKGQDKKNTYRMTKKLAVQYTRILIKDMKEWLDIFNGHGKKDDLADSLLQGYYYLFFLGN